VMLRDERVIANSTEEIATLAAGIKDRSFRVLTGEGASPGDAELHVVNRDGHHRGHDPFAIFAEIEAAAPRPIDASHAFYLGYEMAKAVTALTLGKNYRQDESLDWGMLTRDEHDRRHLRRAGDTEHNGPTERDTDES
jgi:hypothetical protein